jgi:acyl-CoA reductase-like NAD-dependent aldehyde dehydrogenase
VNLYPVFVQFSAQELAALETLDNGKPLGEPLCTDPALAAETWQYFGGW